ncbi:MAG: ABC transporter ATP-binding protein [Bdellovibrionales bacterium]|nr:ABC transporter ATP-binding protein [Bdellovibrionales bacterium]
MASENKSIDLQVENLNIYFDTPDGLVHAVKDLSFKIPQGQTLGLVGESGSGKSVTSLALMRLLGREARLEGKVMFEGQNLLALSEKQMQHVRGRDITMIFQEPMTSLNPVFTVGSQIDEVLRLHEGLSKAQARGRTIELLKEVGIPNAEERVRSYPHELSGGQRQRVMIAMAIACKPKLLIADEPTTALDVTVQKQILDLLQSLQKKYGMSLLFISHDLAVVKSITSHLVVMRKGVAVEKGSTQDVFINPQHPYTKALLYCRPGEILTERLATVSDYMNPDGSEKKFDIKTLGIKQKKESSTETLLEIKNLSKHYPLKKGFLRTTYDWVRAVDNVSFKVQKGTTLGLVGESGCGKTTLGRTILRLIEPSEGQILFNGVDLVKLPPEELRSLRRKIQIVFQDPYSSLNPRLSIGSAIIEPMEIHKIYPTRKECWARAEELMRKVGLEPEHLKRYPHEFSGGQRQRICIARALSVRPEFVILDESVSALDVSVQAQILNLLLDLQKEMNLTYIFISHDLSVVRFISDNVAVMNKGKIVEYGTAEEIYRQPKDPYTQKLLSSIPKL